MFLFSLQEQKQGLCPIFTQHQWCVCVCVYVCVCVCGGGGGGGGYVYVVYEDTNLYNDMGMT